MEAGEGLSICMRVWRRLRKVQLLAGGPRRDRQDMEVKIKVLHVCVCVFTYQSAHRMVSKWPSRAETSDSQSHLTTLRGHRKGAMQTGQTEETHVRLRVRIQNKASFPSFGNVCLLCFLSNYARFGVIMSDNVALLADSLVSTQTPLL